MVTLLLLSLSPLDLTWLVSHLLVYRRHPSSHCLDGHGCNQFLSSCRGCRGCLDNAHPNARSCCVCVADRTIGNGYQHYRQLMRKTRRSEMDRHQATTLLSPLSLSQPVSCLETIKRIVLVTLEGTQSKLLNHSINEINYNLVVAKPHH